MNEHKLCFTETIGNITFVVNSMQSNGAKRTAEEIIRALIEEKADKIKPDAA